MNLWAFVLSGLCTASLLFIQQSDPHIPGPTDKPSIFFLPERNDLYRAKISLHNPFQDKIIGYRISTNKPDRMRITNSKIMSHGYILSQQQRSISMKYSWSTIDDSTNIKLEWVVLDPKSLNPENSDPEALKSLFLTFGRVTTLFKCKETVMRVPEVLRVPAPHSGSTLSFKSDLLSIGNLVIVFLLILITNSLITLGRNIF